jgi:hypothetical protein
VYKSASHAAPFFFEALWRRLGLSVDGDGLAVRQTERCHRLARPRMRSGFRCPTTDGIAQVAGSGWPQAMTTDGGAGNDAPS